MPVSHPAPSNRCSQSPTRWCSSCDSSLIIFTTFPTAYACGRNAYSGPTCSVSSRISKIFTVNFLNPTLRNTILHHSYSTTTDALSNSISYATTDILYNSTSYATTDALYNSISKSLLQFLVNLSFSLLSKLSLQLLVKFSFLLLFKSSLQLLAKSSFLLLSKSSLQLLAKFSFPSCCCSFC